MANALADPLLDYVLERRAPPVRDFDLRALCNIVSEAAEVA